MEKKYGCLLAGFIALLFTVLFYHEYVGLNLLLFELVLLPLILWHARASLKTGYGWIITAGVAVTAIFTLVHASVFVIIMNVVALFAWTGWLLLPAGRSLASFAGLAAGNLGLAPANALVQLVDGSGDHQRSKHLIRQAAWLVIPFFIILVFIWMYGVSNPWFAAILDRIMEFPDKWLTLLFNYIDFQFVTTLALGLFIGVLFVFRHKRKAIPAWDKLSGDNLFRMRRKPGGSPFRVLALKNEYRAGAFLLIILNILLLLQNVLDIWHVWFNFEWNGQYLRQFVHEGTWLLILSVLISIGIVLWLYQGNQNFFRGNRLLRLLSYGWLVQNMVLVISVAVRNGWYIRYYALAYGRIGVAIFLVLAMVGLVTVLIKVKRKKTMYYLLRINTLAAFVLLVAASCINWDPLIARYNFANYQRSFVHLDWLSTLSDKSLPVLDRSPAELARIRQVQDKLFPFEDRYMSSYNYHEIMLERKRNFIIDWENRGFLSFNLADYMAYTGIRTKARGGPEQK